MLYVKCERIAVTTYSHKTKGNGVAATRGRPAGACTSRSAALAHCFRCGGGALCSSKLHRHQARCHHACSTSCASVSLSQLMSTDRKAMEWQTLGCTPADACTSRSAALAHCLRRVEAERCARVNCTAPSSLSPCVLYIVCERIAVTTHLHKTKGNGVAYTGVEAR